MIRIRLTLALACLLAAVGLSAAQVGGITVVVTDAEGAPLAGATVTLRHETGFVKTTSELSDRAGRVNFPVLRPGAGYEIQVSFPGTSPLRYESLRVKINERYTLRVRMIEEVREEVRVTAERELIDLDETETSTKFSDDFIGNLPVLDRFYQSVLTMAPGVQDADGDGNPNVHGSRKRDFQALVGGVSNVDPLTGQWLSRVNMNSIEEMEVITAGAGVEFGRAQGGFARIIQKQGSNRHEGLVGLRFQTSKLDGTGANDVSSLIGPEFENVQPEFQFSGPVIKDRLWYRVSWERREGDEPVNLISELTVQPTEFETQDALLTWQVSPRNKLGFQFRSDPADVGNFGISTRIPVESSENRSRDVETWSLTWTAPYSPRVLVETTLAWQDIGTGKAPARPGELNTCVPNAFFPFIREALCNTSGLNEIGSLKEVSGAFNETIQDQRQRFTLKSQATVYAGRFWGGEHQFKLGISIENERYFRDLVRLPEITFEEVRPFGGIPFGIVLAKLSVPDMDDARATGVSWGIYAEDQFKPFPNLTLTLGARLDREELNSEGREQVDWTGELAAYEETVQYTTVAGSDATGFGTVLLDGIGEWETSFTGYEDPLGYRQQLAEELCRGKTPQNNFNACVLTDGAVATQLQNDLLRKRSVAGLEVRNTNVSPFFSVAWDPWGNGKTAIKASAGRHYNNIPLIVPLQELEPVRTNVEYQASLQTFEVQTNNNIEPNLTVLTVDPGLKTPYQDEFTASIERELWAETSLRVTYINRRFRDQLQDRNINARNGDYGACFGSAAPGSLGTFILASFGGCDPETDPNCNPLDAKFLSDPVTGEVYLDTDPGIGDGRLDDCGGITEYITGSANDPFGTDSTRIRRPDGVPDLYVQNPFWGGVYEIANINSIDYEGWVLELVRRNYRGWQMAASYTYSEAIGDGDDIFQELDRDPSLRDSVRGFQPYDQTHVVKVNATTVTPWGVRLGTSVTWQSGLPFSILAQRPSDDILPPTTDVFLAPGARDRQTFPTGVRNDQRNQAYWNVDLSAIKEFRLGRDLNLQLSAEVFNALADDTYIIYNPDLEEGRQINGVNEARRRFGRRWQVGARMSF